MTKYRQERSVTTGRRRRRFYPSLWISLLLLGCGGSQPELPSIGKAAEEEHTLSWLRRFAIDRVIDYRVWSGARSGFVALIARGGSVVYGRTSGLADIEARLPMALDTRFHLASMTKPITAVAAMILVEEGRLALEEPVSSYIPSFDDMAVVVDRDAQGGWSTEPLTEPIRVRHLLTFSSGIGGYADTDDPLDRAWRSPDIEAAGLGSLAERIERVARRPLYERPDTRWRYGWSLDVLARVIEIAAGEPFDHFLERRIFEPLGMRHTGFPDGLDTDPPLAKMYTHDERGSLVHEPRFDAYYGRGWTPGGGGLVSTAPDYLRFALMLANEGILDGTRILAPETVRNMTRLQVPSGVLADLGIEGLGWGLGWGLGVCVVADASRTIMPSRDGDYWWSGRFGTQFWISPSTDTVVVVMQQTERGPHSDMPVTPSIVQALAMP